VTIIDRQGLEEVSCECYGVIQAAFDKDIVASSNGGTAGLNGGTAGSNGGMPA
jgi:hypothetical protein